MDIYSALTKELRRVCPSLAVRADEPMAGHTSFRIGGPVKLIALPQTEDESIGAVKVAVSMGVEPIFMGNGTDLLVSDQGVDGFIIKAFDGLGTIEVSGGVITAGSGVLLSKLANFARERGLSGLEFAHGIPGSLGGAVTMNAGAYGGEMCSVVTAVTYLTETGERGTMIAPETDFTYRHSAFSDGKRMILGARLTLKSGDPLAIGARMEELIHQRKSKQPLEYPSGGSTFKRPEGYFSAALIEECGLKGVSIGGAQVSQKHAGFIINTGGATSGDVLSLIELVRETVLRERGIALELELKTLGI